MKTYGPRHKTLVLIVSAVCPYEQVCLSIASGKHKNGGKGRLIKKLDLVLLDKFLNIYRFS